MLLKNRRTARSFPKFPSYIYKEDRQKRRGAIYAKILVEADTVYLYQSEGRQEDEKIRKRGGGAEPKNFII